MGKPGSTTVQSPVRPAGYHVSSRSTSAGMGLEPWQTPAVDHDSAAAGRCSQESDARDGRRALSVSTLRRLDGFDRAFFPGTVATIRNRRGYAISRDKFRRYFFIENLVAYLTSANKRYRASGCARQPKYLGDRFS